MVAIPDNLNQKAEFNQNPTYNTNESSSERVKPVMASSGDDVDLYEDVDPIGDESSHGELEEGEELSFRVQEGEAKPVEDVSEEEVEEEEEDEDDEEEEEGEEHDEDALDYEDEDEEREAGSCDESQLSNEDDEADENIEEEEVDEDVEEEEDAEDSSSDEFEVDGQKSADDSAIIVESDEEEEEQEEDEEQHCNVEELQHCNMGELQPDSEEEEAVRGNIQHPIEKSASVTFNGHMEGVVEASVSVHKTDSSNGSGDRKLPALNCNGSDKTDSATLKKMKNIARDHTSIMKKIEYNKKLNDLQQEDVEMSDEEFHEGWEALQEWNSQRERSGDGTAGGRPNGQAPPSAKSSKKIRSVNHNKKLPNGIAAAPENKPSLQNDSCVTKETISEPVLIPQLNELKGYFELGQCSPDDPELKMYMLSVTVVFAKDLKKVVPGALLRSCRRGPHFSYPLLGCPVFTDPLPDPGPVVFPGEEARARLLASPRAYANYLAANPAVHITLMIGEIKLAVASVDISRLVEECKIEKSYELVPVKHGLVSTAAGGKAVVGVCVQLQSEPLLKEPAKGKPSKEEPAVFKEDTVTNRGKKRERLDSTDDEITVNLTKAADNLEGEEVLPPSKKRKTEELSEVKEQLEEGDLKEWRKAQEKVFWNQWLAKERSLQASLSADWTQRQEALQEELQGRLQEADGELQRLQEWRGRLQERERRCQQREDQLLELQERLLQRQLALEPAQEAAPSRREWLRGVASHHRDWSVGRPGSSGHSRLAALESRATDGRLGASSSSSRLDASLSRLEALSGQLDASSSRLDASGGRLNESGRRKATSPAADRLLALLKER